MRKKIFKNNQTCYRQFFSHDCIYFISFINQTLHKKMKFSVKDFFRKCDQIRRKLQIWSHLLKKFLMENFIFCVVREVRVVSRFRFYYWANSRELINALKIRSEIWKRSFCWCDSIVHKLLPSGNILAHGFKNLQGFEQNLL